MTQLSSDYKGLFSAYLTQSEWQWNWVAHLTYDPDKYEFIHSDLVRNSWIEFLAEIGRQATCVYGWVFGELHRNGRPHWHAILHVKTNLFGEPRRKDIWKHMFAKYGRCRIEPFDGNQRELGNVATKTVSDGIARYLTKYVAKEASREEAWWDFGGNMSGREADPRRICAALGLDSGGIFA